MLKTVYRQNLDAEVNSDPLVIAQTWVAHWRFCVRGLGCWHTLKWPSLKICACIQPTRCDSETRQCEQLSSVPRSPKELEQQLFVFGHGKRDAGEEEVMLVRPRTCTGEALGPWMSSVSLHRLVSLCLLFSSHWIKTANSPESRRGPGSCLSHTNTMTSKPWSCWHKPHKSGVLSCPQAVSQRVPDSRYTPEGLCEDLWRSEIYLRLFYLLRFFGACLLAGV